MSLGLFGRVLDGEASVDRAIRALDAFVRLPLNSNEAIEPSSSASLSGTVLTLIELVLDKLAAGVCARAFDPLDR